MSFISSLPSFVKTWPEKKQLDYVVNQLKWMEGHCEDEDGHRYLRRAAVEALNRYGQPNCSLYNDEQMLYVVLLIGKMSRSLGLKGVLQQVYERGQFHELAEFYVQWAKVYAEEKERSRFDEIKRMAIEANARPSSRIDEAFRAMVHEHFEAEEFEQTVDLFAFRNQAMQEDRLFGLDQRNAAAAIPSQMPSSSRTESQAPTSYIPAINPSAANAKHISMKPAIASGTSSVLLIADEEISPEERAAALLGYPYRSELDVNNRPLSVISEEKAGCGDDMTMETSAGCGDNMTVETSYMHMRKENQHSELLPSPIEFSSIVTPAKSTAAVEVAPRSASARRPLASVPVPQPPTPPYKTKEDFPTSSPIELGGTSFTEKFYTKAMQEFSNTLPLHAPRAVTLENETTVLNETEDLQTVAPKSVAPTFDVYKENQSFNAKKDRPTNSAEDGKGEPRSVQKAQFETFKDENNLDPQIMEVHQSQLKSAIGVMNEGDKKSFPEDALHRDEEMPVSVEKEAAATVGEDLFKKPERLPLHTRKSVGFGVSAASVFAQAHFQQRKSFFDIKQVGTQHNVDFPAEFPDGVDEETVAGLFKNKKGGPLTSTPANPLAPGIQDPIDGGFMLSSATTANAADVIMPIHGSDATTTASSAFQRHLGLVPQSLSVPPPPSIFPKIPQKGGNLAPIIERGIREMGINDEKNDLDQPTGRGLKSAIESEVNPWDKNVQNAIMADRRLTPTYMHDLSERIQRFEPGVNVVLGGERFELQALIGEGGFAKVYKSLSEDGKTYAIKYEVPSCRWEVYMCEQLRLRLPRTMLPTVMTIRDAYIYANASAIVYQYHPHGSLLDMINGITKERKTCSGLLVVYLSWQMARILKAVHEKKLIHGDVKPDNFMISGCLHENTPLDEIMQSDSYVLKLIDWGRGIDMAALRNRTFKGRAGTDTFDCMEMLDGRPWTYQTDFFGFISTIHVLIFGKYMETHKNERTGRYGMTSVLKRRWQQRDVLQDIFDMCLNIPDCDSLPQWSTIIEGLAQNIRYTISTDRMQWKNATREFNVGIRR
uniref:Protein kinase domain-containing protein n=2 Tax=Parascaris univalens TaxID=6257 RepID=A0A915AED1_PARUN